jgi:site-specific DNA recombinase
MKAVIYARVSSLEQGKGYSIERQLETCRSFAESESYVILDEFTDIQSAKRPGRKNFDRMLEFAKDHRVNVIVALRTDRLCRNFEDIVAVRELHREYGTTARFVEEDFPQDLPSGRLATNIHVVLAEHYSDELAYKVKAGISRKISKGGWPHKAPYGYRNQGRGKTIVPEPDEAANVEWLFRHYATGNYTLHSLLDEFESAGLVYKNGKARMSIGQLEHILKNPIYYGMMRINGTQHPGAHEPIVSQVIFMQVQNRLSRNDKPRPEKEDSLGFRYSRLMTCARCGCLITAEMKKGKYVYYHCTGNRETVEGKRCKKAYVPEAELDRQFEDVVKALQVDEEYYDVLLDTLRMSHKDEQEFNEKAVKRLEKHKAVLAGRIRQAYDHFLDGKITEIVWEEKTSEWQDEIGEIDIQIQAHSEANYSYLEQGIRIIELARSAYSWYLQQDSTEQRKMLQLLCSNYSLEGSNLHHTYRKPFDLLANGATFPSWLGS